MRPKCRAPIGVVRIVDNNRISGFIEIRHTTLIKFPDINSGCTVDDAFDEIGETLTRGDLAVDDELRDFVRRSNSVHCILPDIEAGIPSHQGSGCSSARQPAQRRHSAASTVPFGQRGRLHFSDGAIPPIGATHHRQTCTGKIETQQSASLSMQCPSPLP